MRFSLTPDVSQQEWRWVALWAGVLVTLTLIPYALAVLFTNNDWTFMGILANPQDGATYFAKIREGMGGAWLYELQHTPSEHEPAGFFLFYLFLGHIARVFGFSPFIIFHLARIAASFFMFTALYRLGAHVWQRQRPRRLFFLLSSVGSGLGWLFSPFVVSTDQLPPDLGIPEAFPLYAAYANPHFPLSIGLLALLTGIYLMVFRPGYSQAPTVENGGSLVLLYSVILALIQPPALIGIGGALFLFVGVSGYTRREIPWHEIRWTSMLVLPALPVAVYYFMVLQTNETFSDFNGQNIIPSPNILLTIISFGLLLAVATPGIYHAIRRFVRDGDQFMLLWLIINLIAIYIPTDLQRRFFIGFIIPVIYFAVRSLEDYWFEHLQARWRQVMLAAVFIAMLPSNLLVISVPLFGTLVDEESGGDGAILLEQEYSDLFDWLNEFGSENEVVLASPETSIWIPAQTPLRPFYAHPFETVPAAELEAWSENFFSGQDCNAVVQGDFTVSYLVIGPREIDYAHILLEDNEDDTHNDIPPELQRCITTLTADIDNDAAIQVFGDITLYTLRELR
jgi:hypothetical protein